MRRAIHKLPMKCRIVTREVGEVLMAAGVKAAELRELSDEELVTQAAGGQGGAVQPPGPGATGQLDNNRRLQVVRRDIARIYTIMRERELGLSAAPTEVTAS